MIAFISDRRSLYPIRRSFCSWRGIGQVEVMRDKTVLDFLQQISDKT
ncbi:MAG: hypothetical protein AAFQ41_16470 [Cyanobacteria bacterium J06623_7]